LCLLGNIDMTVSMKKWINLIEMFQIQILQKFYILEAWEAKSIYFPFQEIVLHICLHS